MKHAISCIILIFITLVCNAQAKLGIVGAAQYNRQQWVSNTVPYKQTDIGTVKFEVGLIADLPFSDRWSVQPELVFCKNTTKHQTDYELLVQRTQYNLGYLKLPVCLTYLLPFARSHIYFGAGPYLGNLVINNYSFYQNNINLSGGKMRVGKSGSDQITAWDYGARLKCGVQFKKGLMVGVYFDKGLKDVNPQAVQTYNNVAGINLAYLFRIGMIDRYNRYPDYYNY